MITVYGIRNCDTVKRARQLLTDRQITHQFHDFRAQGLTPDTVAVWLEKIGPEQLINRRGTTYRSLSPADQAALAGPQAIALLCEQPSLIKRPVFEAAAGLRVGLRKGTEAELLLWLDSDGK